jgi:hypothetical protein
MPNFKKTREAIELSTLLDEQSADNPISHLKSAVQNRNKLQLALSEALKKLELEHLIDHVSLGEITPDGEIKLITQKAGVVSKLKNKLPSLLHYFRESGFALKTVHLKVSPKSTTIESTRQQVRPELIPVQFSEKSKEAWEKLLTEIDQSSPVFNAVKKLLKKIN